MKLGKLEQITDLRSVWKHEAMDFTPWLAKEENLELLSEAVGIDIVVEEQESNVGDFSVDLYATEEGTGRRIIIENQLEETNHDHLGKIITYASGKDAEVIIWIVKKARDEHKQAIEWLNQHTDDKFEFFLIEIELWKINDSEPAPKFNIVERPNNWAKAMKKTAGLSETENLKLAFWEKFNNEAPKYPVFMKDFKLRKPQAQHWYNLGMGSSAYHLCMTLNTKNNCLSAGLYINEDKDIFDKFKTEEESVAKTLGVDPKEIVWRLDDNKNILVDMDSADRGYLIGYRGEVLNSLQQLLNNIANKDTDEKTRVLLNIGGYKEKREKDLQNLADKIAGTVIKTKKSITLEPMTSYERKIIHTKLQENPKVFTHSIGEEPNRRLVVSLKK